MVSGIIFHKPIRSSLSSIAQNILRSPEGGSFVAFLLIYLASVHYCSVTYFRDPTSAFFDPARAYQRSYSIQRQGEADHFIDNLNSSFARVKASHDPRLCVGIVSVKRDAEQYVRSTVGSLLHGLTEKERQEVYLSILIAHTAPHVHPFFREEWLTAASDKVLLYDVDQEQFNKLLKWEENNDYRWKAVFDYVYSLRDCLGTSAQWIAMLEDDTIAVAGWYPRLIEALEKADEQQRWTRQTDWLYLRLFYTEEFLGWNSEEWPLYFSVSIAVVATIGSVLLLLRSCQPRRNLRGTFIAMVCFLITPACIVLYFLAGRLSMQPLPPGLSEMPNFGCCGQGLVFSREMAPRVVDRLSERRVGFVDSLIEEYAKELDLKKLVVIPSLLQHIGAKTSKEVDLGEMAKSRRTVAERIWNFGFEMYNTRPP